MAKLKFNIVKVPLTNEEKLERVKEYNNFGFEQIDENEFVKQDIYDEYIDLKCLNCGYEERAEADIILECFNPREEDYPISYCPNCNKSKQVPKDIYNQIKAK